MPTANNTSFRRWFPWPPSSTSSYNKTTRFVPAKCQQHQQKKHFGKSKLHCFHAWRVKWTSRVGLENRKMSAHHVRLIVCYTGALRDDTKNGCVADYIRRLLAEPWTRSKIIKPIDNRRHFRHVLRFVVPPTCHESIAFEQNVQVKEYLITVK